MTNRRDMLKGLALAAAVMALPGLAEETDGAGARAKIVGGELLEADGLATGARFLSKRPTAAVANGTCRLMLPPASILCVRLGAK